MTGIRIWAAFGVALLTAGLSWVEPVRAVPASSAVRARAGVGMGLNAGSIVSLVDLRIVGRRGRFSGGLRMPLQLQLLDTSAGVRDTDRGLREKDWDQRSEWLRLVDHAAWRWRSRDGGRASLVVAPLHAATLGHGSIMHRYQATLRPDRFKSGVRARWDLHSWGGDLLTDDVTSARLSAGRLFVRPLARTRREIARTFVIGVTGAVDRRAPIRGLEDAGGRRMYTADGELIANRDRVFVGGVDLSVELIRTRTWSLVPYTDVNYTQLGPGSGLSAHFGLRAALWPTDKTRSVALRYELRSFDGAATPSYFDALYEVESARWLATGVPQTKAQAVFGRGGLGRGHLIELTGRLARARWAAVLQLFDQPNLDSASVWLELPWSDQTSARMMVTRRRFSGLPNLLQAGQWTAAARVKATLVKPFEVYATVRNAWHVQRDPHPGLVTSIDGIVGLSLTNAL